MAGIDWIYLADKSGESIESLIATLLRQKFTTARQTNPSQGDGGIDVLMDTPDGLVVWQVKKFTTPLSSSQWTQVKRSWKRFNKEHVAKGEKIAHYYLVTPWTPTEERIADFDAMTLDVNFPTQWDGEAFINGLADRFPGTIDRFIHGPDAFERFVLAKSVLAGSPIERAEETTMLEALASRQSALDEIRDTMFDNYRIEHSQITVQGENELPLPPPSAAIFHRMTYLGDGRWTTESVVPTSADALAVEPMSLEVTFLDPEGTPQHQAVREWMEWGIPFRDVRARTIQRGGPFGSETHEDSLLSFSAVAGQTPPALLIRITRSDGSLRLVQPLRTTELTHGASTGWIRLLAETPNKVLSFDFRLRLDAAPKAQLTVGNVEGADPEIVLREVETFLAIEESDEVVIEIDTGVVLLQGRAMRPPSALAEVYLPLAAGLRSLQASTTSRLMMPNVMEIETGQFDLFLAYVSIYEGHPKEREWTESKQVAPEDPAALEGFKADLRRLASGEQLPVIVERPTFTLATTTYQIDRAITTRPHSIAPIPAADIENVQPGQAVLLKPGADRRVTTSALPGWPEEDVNFLPSASDTE